MGEARSLPGVAESQLMCSLFTAVMASLNAVWRCVAQCRILLRELRSKLFRVFSRTWPSSSLILVNRVKEGQNVHYSKVVTDEMFGVAGCP